MMAVPLLTLTRLLAALDNDKAMMMVEGSSDRKIGIPVCVCPVEHTGQVEESKRWQSNRSVFADQTNQLINSGLTAFSDESTENLKSWRRKTREDRSKSWMKTSRRYHGT